VFDVATGKELMQIPDHSGPVRALAFAADNRTLASAGMDKAARLTDVGAIAVFDAHAGGVTGGVQFHSNPGAPQVATGGADKTVKLWEVATGKVARIFGPLDAPVSAVAYSRDFTQVGAAAGKAVKVWNLADGKELQTLTHPADVLSLSFSVDKGKVVTGSADNSARVWDLATGKEMQRYARGGPVGAVAFHNSNTAVVAGGADKALTVQPVSVTRVVPVSTGPARALGMTPNGSHMLTGGDDKTVKLVNVANGAVERDFAGAEGPVFSVTDAKNNALVAAGGADRTVRLYNFADGKQLTMMKAPGVVRGLSVAPNNATLAAACDDKSVATWNVTMTPGQPPPQEFGKTGQVFAHAAPAFDVAFAADNVTLYSGGGDKTVKVWKFAADGATKNLAHPNLVDAVAFDPTGNLLATGCHDGQLRVWDVQKANVTKAIVAHPGPQGQPPSPIYAVVWSPDGKQVVSGSYDKSLKLWDAASGNLVREFKAYDEKAFPQGHRDGVFTAAFSPDGKLLVSGSSDRTIKVWNVADGSGPRPWGSCQCR
jgi:WD40 repeat protein